MLFRSYHSRPTLYAARLAAALRIEVMRNQAAQTLSMAATGMIFMAACVAASSAAPNVVLLYADDWRHDTLGAAGHPVVKTPSIDALAAGGVRFEHAYVTTSICGVSRASMLTGQWMSRHGARGMVPFETPWQDTVVARLRTAGYDVAHVGKWHNGKEPPDEYDHSVTYHGKHWYQVDGVRTHVTVRNQRDAIAFLRNRRKDRPFFLTVAFFAPHAEDKSPQQYLPQDWSADLYAGTKVAMPPNNSLESWRRLPPFFNEDNEGRRRWRLRFDTAEKYRMMMTNYYRLVTEVDRACGAVLDELSAQGEREETLVIFTGDNGYYHGEHGLADKWYPHQESIRVPLVIDDPRMPDACRGTTRDELVLNVDLAPTILGAADVPTPTSMQGTDVAPLYLEQDDTPWRREFFYEHPTYRSADFIPASEALVRKDWKYMHWPETGYEQLFDIRNDPREENDLARRPEHKQQLVRMRTRFNELKEAAK